MLLVQRILGKGKPVRGAIRGAENDHSLHKNQNTFCCVQHDVCPQLNMPYFFLLLLVKEKQQGVVAELCAVEGIKR